MLVGNALTVHQDALCHADEVTRAQRGLPIGSLSRSDEGNGGVRGEQFPDDLRLRVERVDLRGIDVQGAKGQPAGEEPIAEHRPHSVRCGSGGKAGPPGIGRHVVDAVAALFEHRLHTGSFVKVVLDGVDPARHVAGGGDGAQHLAFPERHCGRLSAGNRVDDRLDDASHHLRDIGLRLQRARDVAQRFRYVDARSTAHVGRPQLIVRHLAPLARYRRSFGDSGFRRRRTDPSPISPKLAAHRHYCIAFHRFFATRSALSPRSGSADQR